MDVFRCPGCCNLYNIKLKDPHLQSVPFVLECGHNLCQTCFRKSNDDLVICPICKREFDTNNTKVVPNVYIAARLVNSCEEPRISGTCPLGSSARCDECNNSVAQFRCLQCEALYCDACYSAIHDNSVVLRKHTKCEIQEGLDLQDASVVQKLVILSHLEDLSKGIILHNEALKENIQARVKNGTKADSDSVAFFTSHTERVFARIHGLLSQVESRVNELTQYGANNAMVREINACLNFTLDNLPMESREFTAKIEKFAEEFDKILKTDISKNKNAKSESNESTVLLGKAVQPIMNESVKLESGRIEITSNEVTGNTKPKNASSHTHNDYGSSPMRPPEDFHNFKCQRSPRKSPYNKTKFDAKMRPQHGGAHRERMVVVTHVVSPSLFFIRFIDMNGQLERINAMLKNLSRTFDYILDRPNDGFIGMAVYEGECFRGKILKTNEDDYTVQLIDHGETVNIPKNRFFMMPQQAIKPLPLAIECYLSDFYIPSANWTEEDVKAFKNIVHGAAGRHPEFIMKRMKRVGEIYEVSLCFIDGVRLRDAAVFVLFGVFTPPINAARRPFLQNYDFTKRDTYSVKIMHAYNPEKFYVTKHLNDFDQLATLTEEMCVYYGNNYDSATDWVYAPYVGMPVAVQRTDKKWYRAEVLYITNQGKLADRKFTVFLVDVGVEEIVAWNCTRKLHDKFVRRMKLVAHCKLAGIELEENWCVLACEMLKNLKSSGEILKMTVETISSDNVHDVLLFRVGGNRDVCINTSLVEGKHVRAMPSRNRTNTSENYLSVTKNSMRTHKGTASGNKTMADKFPNRRRVEILSCTSPSSIYVSFNDHDDLYKSFIDFMNAFYNDRKRKHEVIKDFSNSDYLFAYVDEHRCWHRAKIVDILPNETVTIFLVDSYKRETVNKTTLRRLDDQFKEMSGRSKKCHLSGLIPVDRRQTWTRYEANKLKEYIKRYKEFYVEIMGNISDESIPITLWARYLSVTATTPCVVKWFNFNKFLTDFGLACRGGTSPGESNVSWENVKEIVQKLNCGYFWWINVGEADDALEDCDESDSSLFSEDDDDTAPMDDEFSDSKVTPTKPQIITEYKTWLPPTKLRRKRFLARITNLTDSMTLFLQVDDDVRILTKINEVLNMECEDGKAPAVVHTRYRLNQSCLAKYLVDNSWYRARIIQLYPGQPKAKIVFVDYGNEETVDFANLRNTVKMIDIPILCHECKITRIKPNFTEGISNSDIIDCLYTLIVEKQCEVTISKHEDGRYQVDKVIILESMLDYFEHVVSLRLARSTDVCEQLSHDSHDDDYGDYDYDSCSVPSNLDEALSCSVLPSNLDEVPSCSVLSSNSEDTPSCSVLLSHLEEVPSCALYEVVDEPDISSLSLKWRDESEYFDAIDYFDSDDAGASLEQLEEKTQEATSSECKRKAK